MRPRADGRTGLRRSKESPGCPGGAGTASQPSMPAGRGRVDSKTLGQLIICRMALDRSTALVVLLLAACVAAPNDQAQTGAGGPDPSVICQHVRTLATKDNGDEQVLDQLQRQCVQSLQDLESRYVGFSTCVENAT